MGKCTSRRLALARVRKLKHVGLPWEWESESWGVRIEESEGERASERESDQRGDWIRRDGNCSRNSWSRALVEAAIGNQ